MYNAITMQSCWQYDNFPTGQGNRLSQFYGSLNPPEQFIVGIGNPGTANVHYRNYNYTCDNDGSIFQGDVVAPNPPINTAVKQRHHYMLASMEYVSPLESQSGKAVKRIAPATRGRTTEFGAARWPITLVVQNISTKKLETNDMLIPWVTMRSVSSLDS